MNRVGTNESIVMSSLHPPIRRPQKNRSEIFGVLGEGGGEAKN